MKHPRALRGFWLGAVLMACASTTWALSLGSLVGVPLIGRPLDVAIQVRLDEGTEALLLCLKAEVLQGDTRRVGGVSTRLESAGTGASVRVRTFKPIEEPVVTVILHAGCTQPLTRHYVLLAELAEDVPQVPHVPAVLSPPVAATRPDQPEAAALRRPRAVSARSSPDVPSGPAGAATVRRVPRREGLVERLLPRAASKSAVKPRLKLEPLDLMLEPKPSLKLTLLMESRPGATPQERANAAATWKTLSITPAEQVQSLQQIQAQDVDLKAMRQLLTGIRSELGEVRAQLQESRRDLSALAWGLSLAGVLLVAALFYRQWKRFRRPLSGPHWWHDSNFAQEAAPDPGPPGEEGGKPRTIHHLDLDLDLDWIWI